MSEILPPPLVRMTRRYLYPAEDACIYCGRDSSAAKLSDEHIIAESIGGMLVVPAASCEACAAVTSAFEGRNAGRLFRPLRRQLGFPQKKRGRKAREKAQAETFELILDDKKKILVPSKEFPGLLLSFAFEPPGIFLSSRIEKRPFTGGIALATLPEFGERLNAIKAAHNASKVSIPTTGDTESVGRLLAKTAHAYAVAEIGRKKFRPFLLDIIFGRTPNRMGHFIGSAIGEPPQGADLHQIEIDRTGLMPAKFVVVKLQLFSDRKMPVHYVVAGEQE